MSLVTAILEDIRRGRELSFDQIAFSRSGAAADVIAAPGAGMQLVVLDGLSVAGAVAGDETWLAGAAALTGVMTATAGSSKRLGPWKLPENTALRASTTTATINGWVAFATLQL